MARIERESEKTFISSIQSIDLAREYFERVIGLRNGELQFDLPVESVTSDLLAGLYKLEGLEGEGVAQG